MAADEAVAVVGIAAIAETEATAEIVGRQTFLR
jgi:hypothetical protein